MGSSRAVAVVVLVLGVALSPSASPSSPDSARPGTIPWMRTLPVGSDVKLDAMIVDKVGADYLVVREPCAAVETIMVDAPADVKRWQSVEVTGLSVLDANGQMYLAEARVFAYLDSEGSVMLAPIPKSTVAPFARWGTVDVTLPPGESAPEEPPAAPCILGGEGYPAVPIGEAASIAGTVIADMGCDGLANCPYKELNEDPLPWKPDPEGPGNYVVHYGAYARTNNGWDPIDYICDVDLSFEKGGMPGYGDGFYFVWSRDMAMGGDDRVHWIESDNYGYQADPSPFPLEIGSPPHQFTGLAYMNVQQSGRTFLWLAERLNSPTGKRRALVHLYSLDACRDVGCFAAPTDVSEPVAQDTAWPHLYDMAYDELDNTLWAGAAAHYASPLEPRSGDVYEFCCDCVWTQTIE